MTPMTSFLPWAKARRLVADPSAPARPAAPMAVNRLRPDGLRTSPDILFSLSCNTEMKPLTAQSTGRASGFARWLRGSLEKKGRKGVHAGVRCPAAVRGRSDKEVI